MANLAMRYLDSYATFILSHHYVCALLTIHSTSDCIRFVEGDRVEMQAILRHRYDMVFFTGGQFVGQMVAEVNPKQNITYILYTFLHINT
jgi:acyl-CoA reductase-like NAD-dependent aldehyde dehydrogenase